MGGRLSGILSQTFQGPGGFDLPGSFLHGPLSSCNPGNHGLFCPMPRKAPSQKKDEPPVEPEEVPPVAEPFDYIGHQRSIAAQIWSRDELDFDLTIEDQLFVRSYVIDRNPIATLRRLGYADDPSKLKSRSAKFLAKAEVKAAIDYLAKRMMDKLDITAERVQRQIAAVAFFDPREVFEFDNRGAIILNSKYWTEEQAVAIKSIKMGQYGIEIGMYDRLKAAEMLAKQLGVQPEDNNMEDAFRIAADQAMDKIGTVLSRLLPGGRGVQQEMQANDPLVIEHKSKSSG